MNRSVGMAGLTSLAVLLAACAGAPAEDQAADESQTKAKVLDQSGDARLQNFDVRRQGRRLQVRVADTGQGSRVIIVTARSFRGVDRADSRIAYDAAFEAGERIDCGGGSPLRIFPDSALFQEDGRRTAYTNGEPAWTFRGQCG